MTPEIIAAGAIGLLLAFALAAALGPGGSSGNF
jgi:hypothetical protein